MLTFWKEEYRIGVDEIDRQHKIMCDLMGRFQEALDDGASERAIEKHFVALRTTLTDHFRNEERYLSRIDYPEADLREHVDGHLDVLFTFDHEFSLWKGAADGDHPGPHLPNLCTWAIGELLSSDLKVKSFLDMHKAGDHHRPPSA